MQRSTAWFISLCIATALAGCGGGGSDGEDTGPVLGTQQYPGGIWEGTVGTGTAQRTMVGYIDPGSDGKGGEFFLARGATGAAGYDALFGVLRVDVTAVQATGVTYFSVQDGKFASSLTVRGTASADATSGKTTAISGNYSNPAQTAAATGTTTSFKLSYSSLNNYQASASLLAGTYRGSGVFGGGWVLTVSPQGLVSGRIGGCTTSGTAAPRSTGSPLYAMTLNMSGDTTSCGIAGTQQAGIAALRYDSAGVPSGIWVFLRNATGDQNVYVLDGLADPRTVTTPSATPLSVAGNWLGTLTLPAGVIGDSSVWGSVLPDGGVFLYTNSSFDHNALYGRLINYENNASSNRFVTASDGVYFDRQLGTTGTYTEGVLIDSVLESATGAGAVTKYSGTYSYATQPGGYPTRFSMVPDPLYTLPTGAVPSTTLITGIYQMAGSGFGGHTSTVTVWEDGAITGVTSNGCLIVGKLLGELGSGLNLYRVEAFGYLGNPTTPSNSITCELATGPSQSGSAAAQFDSNGNVTGLRILAAGLSITGERAHTVFVGTRQ